MVPSEQRKVPFGTLSSEDASRLPLRSAVDSSRLDALEKQYKTDPEFRESVKGADRPLLESIEEERGRAKVGLQKADLTRAALIFGVPQSEILFNVYSSQRQAGKINLTADPGVGDSGARHRPVAGQGVDFKPGMITAFDINKAMLATPARAQGALFHEVSHLKDFELAQRWVDVYQKETGRMFVGGPGVAIFKDWINAQARKKPPRLSAAEAELVVDEAADVSATTEARANIRTFLEFFRAGIFDEATRELTNYASALPPGRIYAAPPPGSPVVAELTNELKAAFNKASKSQRSQFEAAMDLRFPILQRQGPGRDVKVRRACGAGLQPAVRALTRRRRYSALNTAAKLRTCRPHGVRTSVGP